MLWLQNQDLSSRVLWGILEVLPVLAPKGRAVQPLGSHLQGLQTVPRAGGAAFRRMSRWDLREKHEIKQTQTFETGRHCKNSKQTLPVLL